MPRLNAGQNEQLEGRLAAGYAARVAHETAWNRRRELSGDDVTDAAVADAKVPEPAPPSLTHTTARGFFWFASQTLGAKAIGMGTQIVLAWLLDPDDFGVIGLAYTLTAFASLIQVAGLRDVLVQRHRQFARWANSAFWLSLGLGMLAGLAMAGAAPLAVLIYGDKRLLGLILVMAASTPLTSLATVPLARLQSDLRFRTAASIAAIEAFGMPLLSVLFAWLGFGAYSFVLPRVVTSSCQAALLFWLSPVRLSRNPQWRRWPALLGNTAMLLAAQAALTLAGQGDRLMLGLFYSTAVVGIYFFAYNLSTQAVQLLAINLLSVLLPSLSQLQSDVKRQTAAFLRVTRLLAAVSTPACFVQAALAGPIVHLLFARKWDGSIPALSVLSIGMAFAIITGPSWSMMKAQGRFGAFFLYACGYAGAVVIFSFLGVLLAGMVGVAVGTSLALVLLSIPSVYLAGKPGGVSWSEVVIIHAKPATLSAIAVGFPAAVAFALPGRFSGDWMRIILVTVISSPIYWVLARRYCGEEWAEFIGRVRGLFRRS